MKPSFLIHILLFLPVYIIGQNSTTIDTVSGNDLQNLKNGTYINVYRATDNNYYKKGDTLILGTATGQQQSAFNHKLNYAYVFYGRPGAVLLKGLRYVEENYHGYKLKIETVRFSKGGLGLEDYVFFLCKPLADEKFSIIDEYVTVTMADRAISSGEIIPKRISRPMTRDEAIQYLKNKREELELELITQREYDSIKIQLMPIIRQ